MAETILTDIQQDMTDRLLADEYFSNITVVNADCEDVASEIEMALSTVTEKGGKIGVAVIVTQPTAEDANANALFGPLDVFPSVLILENPVMNRDATSGTQKKAHWVARRVSRVFKLASADGLHTPMVPRRPHIVPTGVEELKDLAPIAYEVNFQCREMDPTAYSKVAQPVISYSAPNVTLTCATPGATIFYTFDGSFPRLGGASVEQYTGSFAAVAGDVVRAAAYLSGSFGSDVARLLIP